MIAQSMMALGLLARLAFAPQAPPDSQVGVATLHKAMDSVLSVYPERARKDVDGYIGVVDCADIGQEYWLALRDRVYRVVAADCLAPQHYKANRRRRWCIRPENYAIECRRGTYQWLVDVDERLWRGAEVPQLAVMVKAEAQPPHRPRLLAVDGREQRHSLTDAVTSGLRTRPTPTIPAPGGRDLLRPVGRIPLSLPDSAKAGDDALDRSVQALGCYGDITCLQLISLLPVAEQTP